MRSALAWIVCGAIACGACTPREKDATARPSSERVVGPAAPRSSESALPVATSAQPPAGSAHTLTFDSTPCLLWMPPKLRKRPAYARVFELEAPTIKIGPVGPVHGIGDMDTAIRLDDDERVIAAIMICNAPLFLVRRAGAVVLDFTAESGTAVRPRQLFPGDRDRPLDPRDDALRVVGICRTATRAHYALAVGTDHLLVTWSDGAFEAQRMEALGASTLRCEGDAPAWVEPRPGQTATPK